MPLTDRQIKNAKPADKAYKLTDGSAGCICKLPLRAENYGGLITR